MNNLAALNLVEVAVPDRVPVGEVRAALRRDGVAVLRGLVGADEARDAVARLRAGFDPARDAPTVGEAPSAVRGNYQKLSIGTVHGEHRIGAHYARLLRVLFNPLIAPDIYGLHGIFRRVAAVRNELMGLPPGFACASIDDGFFTASRVQHYPLGGGFLGVHRDLTSEANIAGRARRYFQMAILLSQRGDDFEQGGGFVERDGERVMVENGTQRGDIVLYDGSMPHGVADIDPHRVLEMNELTGRLAGFVTLYRCL